MHSITHVACLFVNVPASAVRRLSWLSIVDGITAQTTIYIDMDHHINYPLIIIGRKMCIVEHGALNK